MRTIVIVSRAGDWPLEISGVEVVIARDYLVRSEWATAKNIRVYNLCRSYRYQNEGYYVSLLAAARRHRPFPSLMTVLDMKNRAVVRIVDEELDQLVQKGLSTVKSDKFELSVYFGRNMAKRHERLASKLFAQFPAPLLRASFLHTNVWRLSSVTPIAFCDVPESHFDFVRESAVKYFARPRFTTKRKPSRYDLAILHDPEAELAPSTPKTLKRFQSAAEKVGFSVEMIQKGEFARLPEFDALFIRETTYVNHHTFRFAQRAEFEGLVVIDDPTSILRCTNKVFQTEVFANNNVPTPKTWITDSVTAEEVESRIGFPCVLKVPDSAFSQGVVKCENVVELERESARMLIDSDLLLIQEFTPSDFDWRVGTFDGEVLFACRYHMARAHWQIVKKTEAGSFRYGRVDSVPLDEVPDEVLKIALRAAATIGKGLYGVDLKQIGSRVVVTEVNDNPNIDAGCEDTVLKDELYLIIMRGILKRVEARKQG
ncbi:MAG: glutathione synthase/RimK-type ligase-like ATP-grasp enzyme [Planctomycetota bacterium]|jgi:glutathione synthase/RimK-type ligase-like ATP-grasp enzyme